MSFEVWAPRPSSVELQALGHNHSMTREPGGLWRIDLDVPPGTDYGYVLDGQPVPDPRSPNQPEGVHGPSRTIDHEAFPWSDAEWQGFDLRASVLYELHVGTFTAQGTFKAVTEKLDHLCDLGITAIELMPVAEFAGSRGWGYDGVDLFAPHHAYGGPDALKELIDVCHSRGIGVILDVVYNHLGPDGNYLELFGPYFTNKYSTPWGPAVNFDGPGSDAVRAFVCDNAEMWLRDYHFDGLRLDAIHAIYDCSAVHILEELSERVRLLEDDLARPLWLIAESDLNDPRIVGDVVRGGYGIDAQWNDDFHHALHTLVTEESAGYYEDFGSFDDLAKSVSEVFVYDGRYSKFRDRRHGRPAKHLPRDRFIVYSQNHDQVGNRAKGERLSNLVPLEDLFLPAALVLLGPMIPMLFQGEEWGATSPFLYFTDHNEELGRAVSEGRRKEFAAFGWRPEDVPDPQDPVSFQTSVLDWQEIVQDEHSAMLEWHKRLIEIRTSQRRGSFAAVEVHHEPSRKWISITNQTLVVAANFGGEVVEIPCPGVSDPVASIGRVGADTSLCLGPRSLGVWSRAT